MRWLPDAFMHRDGSVRKDWIAYLVTLPLVDAAAASAALALAWYAEPGDVDVPAGTAMAIAGLVVAAWLATSVAFGLYGRERLLSGTDEYARVFQASALLPVGLVLVDFVLAADLMSRGWLLWFWPSMIGFAGASRMLTRRTVRMVRRSGAFRTRVIIIGVDQRAVRFAHRLTEAGYEVLGFFDDYRPVGSRVGSSEWFVLGAADELLRASDLGADEVIVIPSAVSWESRRSSLSQSWRARFDVRVLADRDDALSGHIRVSQRAGVPVYAVPEMRLSGVEAAAKRVFDVTVAGLLTACVGPFALARIAGRVATGRTVFERHALVGARERRFRAYTLAGGGSRVVAKLPAVLAVLKGDMSIVGPIGMADDDAATPPELSTMKPGLTSAVWADRDTVDAASAIAIQIDYVRNYSIWRDLQVLWHRTLALRRMGRPAECSTAFWKVAAYAGQQLEQKI